MGINLKQALVFVPQDSEWVQKVFIGGLLLFFPTVVYVFPGIRRLIFDPLNYYLIALFLTFTAVVYLAICGYFFKTVHNRIVHDKEGLPSWSNFTYYVYVGLKAYIGGLIFSIPFIALLMGIAALSPMTASPELLPYIMAAGVLYVIYAAFYIMVALNFAIDFKISSFLNVKKAYSRIKENILSYLYLVLYCLAIALVYTVISLILSCAQIFALLLPFVSFYTYLIYTDLFAQFVQPKEHADLCDDKECFI